MANYEYDRPDGEQRDPVVDTRPRAHVALSRQEDTEIQFADGVRVVPGELIGRLRYHDNKEKIDGIAAGVTWETFRRSFEKSQERKALNNIGAAFVTTALRNRRGA